MINKPRRFVSERDGGDAATEDKPNVLIKANIDEGAVSAVEISALSNPFA